MVVFLQPAIKVLVADSIIALQWSLLSYLLLSAATVMDVRPLQLPNAPYPILATELGMMMDECPEQPWKAHFPILVTELGIVMDVKPEQPSNA